MKSSRYLSTSAKVRKAGGKGTYFGKVAEVAYADAKENFRKHLGTVGQPRRIAITCDEVCDRHLKWLK